MGDDDVAPGRCDLVTLLAAAIKSSVPFLPITWQAGRPYLGQGHFAQISQPSDTSLVFRRVALDHPGAPKKPEIVYMELIKVLAVLRHLKFQGNKRIIEVQGICWDVVSKPNFQTGHSLHDSVSVKVPRTWSVLDFERARCVDLHSFSRTSIGQALNSMGRLWICWDIGQNIGDVHFNRDI